MGNSIRVGIAVSIACVLVLLCALVAAHGDCVDVALAFMVSLVTGSMLLGGALALQCLRDE